MVSGVGKTYPDGTEVLRKVNLQICSGEGVVLLGANGCGKSTLLRCMLGLETLTSGDIVLGGQSVQQLRGRSLRQLRAHIGSVFQQFNLVGNLSVFQNVLFGRLGNDGLLRSLNLTCSRINRERAMHCLDRVGLAHLASKRTDSLSGGQQQRVAIARMLMQDVKIVFADEPVASLDPKAGREVMDLLFEVVHEHKLTVVCVLHQLELATEYAQRLVGLKGGEIVLDLPPGHASPDILATLYDREQDGMTYMTGTEEPCYAS
ncbi:phosphonate ABC transporter ATP-binding protein [Nitrincola lacisaponensis]|uniref:phosphonate ABC transporter ATP-binding protein n=1 Tax=Nitrincola lacisaponensis TaxID=267850 RepID=UPI00391CA78A